ncbi:MAG TPA: ribosomal-processing cysteine protease Prp [Candidatus Rifleibacterium sp.]|nr:ribosomal-processing cysteine protease Prp [Candidatus Rifleibacterium sp.]HPT47533.1 ribosomal-processing cysteine protease Prp [Candidatus Rifleibacterium sp.]
MIEVDFSVVSAGQVALKVTGHSGMADKGYDIVCAAVSTLVQTLTGGLEKVLDAKVEGALVAGSCDLSIRVPETEQQGLEVVCQVFKFGFRKIAESYPDHVKLNSVRGIYHGS